MACKAAAIRGGTASVASSGRSRNALSAIVDGAGKVAKDMVETLIAKVGRKTFQGIANRQDVPLTAAEQSDARAPLQPASSATETNMTICTSSFIRTLTVGSGFSPDLLTPYRHVLDIGARGLAGSRFRAAGIPPVGNFTPP